jgi:hypothetical protein
MALADTSFVFIGCGRVGRTLARALAQVDCTVIAAWSRNPDAARRLGVLRRGQGKGRIRCGEYGGNFPHGDRDNAAGYAANRLVNLRKGEIYTQKQLVITPLAAIRGDVAKAVFLPIP